MKVVKHKLFFIWQLEEEEKWLNEMSEFGLQLCDVGFCRYVFEESEPSQYKYKLQLLDKLPSTDESRDYILFIEDMGIDYIGSYSNWVYFRKKNDGTDFEIFSDIKSVIRQMNKVLKFCFWMMICCIASFMNLILSLKSNFQYNVFWLCVIMSVFVILGSMGTIKLYRKKRQLLKDAEIQE